MINGESAEQIITFHPVNSQKMDFVYKALLKTAYLYCFKIWGYGFIYSETANRIRNIIFKNESHILSKWGIFFHMDNEYIPDGLYFIHRPTSFQAFIVNFRLTLKETNFKCSVIVLIPGAESNNWEQSKLFQPVIDNYKQFQLLMVKLPEISLSNNNLFPYTNPWNQRHLFKVPSK